MPSPKNLNGEKSKILPPKKTSRSSNFGDEQICTEKEYGKNEILMFGNMIRILFILIGMTRQLWRYLPGPK